MTKTITVSRRGRLPGGIPNPVDVHVGHRMRLRRHVLDLSQEKLAELLGLTFQQVQKYEKGMNRISASRLWDISRVLGVPVEFFFEEMSEDTLNQSPRMFVFSSSDLQQQKDYPLLKADPMHTEEIMRLVAAFNRITNKKIAEELIGIIKYMSKVPAEETKELK